MKKRVLEMTDDEYHLLINAMNNLRSTMIKEKVDTIDIDRMLLHIIDCPYKKACWERIHAR